MSSLKEKRFKFEEDDLDWINPLILEWTEENEGKKKSDLITDLLKDYKQKRDAKALKEERAHKLKENVNKIKDPLDNSLNTVNNKFSAAMKKLEKKTDTLELDAKLDRTGELLKENVDKIKEPLETSFNKSISKASTGLNRFLSKSTEKIKEITNQKKSDE